MSQGLKHIPLEHRHISRMSIYSYTFNFDTFKNDTFKVSFSDILRHDYLDHFDTFAENFDFDTFKNDTFESVWVVSG